MRQRPPRWAGAAGVAGRLQLEQLPADAPELHPDEGVWRYLKWVELRNRCCPRLWHLLGDVRSATARPRRRPRIVRACIRHAGSAA